MIYGCNEIIFHFYKDMHRLMFVTDEQVYDGVVTGLLTREAYEDIMGYIFE